MDSMKFTLTLEDALSGPATRMDGALERVERGLKDLDGPLKRLDRSLDSLGSKFDAVDRRLDGMTRAMQQGTAASTQLQTAQLRALAQMEITARKTHEEMVQVVRDLGAVGAASNRLGGGSSKAAGGGLFGGGLFGTSFAAEAMPALFVLDSVLGKIESIGSALLNAGLAAGKFGLDVAGSWQGRVRDFTRVFGGRDAGMRELGTLDKISDLTPFDDKTVSSLRLSLMGAGVKSMGEFTSIASMLSDIGTTKGTEAGGRVQTQLLQMLSKRSLSEGDLRPMIEAAPDLISESAINRILAERRHTTVDAILKLRDKGGIGGREGVAALMESVRQSMHEDKLGDVSVKAAAERLDNVLSNVQSHFERLFRNVDISPVLGALDNLQKVLDPTSESGKRAADVVGRFFDVLFRPLERYKGDEGLKLLTADFDRLVGVLDRAVTLLDKLEGVGEFGARVAGSMAMGDIKSNTSTENALGAGSRWSGALNPMNWPTMALMGWLSADQKHADGGIVTTPHLGLVGESGPELILPLDKAAGFLGGGMQVHAPIELHVHVPPGSDGEGIGSVIRHELTAFFEQLAEQRAAPA